MKAIGAGEARIIDGRTIERQATQDADGRRWHYWVERIRAVRQVENVRSVLAEMATDRRPAAPPPVAEWQIVQQWNEAPRETFDRFAGLADYAAIDPRTPSPIHDELEAAMASGYTASAGYLAAQAKLQPRPVVERALFEAGATQVQRGLQLSADVIRSFIHRHQQGDFGVFGDAKDAELDDDRRWAPPIFGRLTINAVSIEAGVGLVHSAFPVEIPAYTGGVYPRPAKEPARTRLGILTILGDGDPRTLVWRLGTIDYRLP